MFLGHAHADEAAALLFDRNITAVVEARDEPRHPVARELGVAAQGRDGAVGHGRGAERAALDLGLHQVPRSACHVRAGDRAAALTRPRSAVITACRDALHEHMPGWVKFEGVDALAAHIEVLQHRGMAIGEPTMLEVRESPDRGPFARELCGMRRRPFARDGVLERLIARV